ncbi:delta-12 fatty acid desaturase protein [Amylostereum chailletii]|nr:delta-12 fatty acid desaturase protein [Amylostereum chailletii]
MIPFSLGPLFQDGPEYSARLKQPFSPPTVTLKEVHAAVPRHLLKKSPLISAYYIARDILLSITFFILALQIARITGWSTSFIQSGHVATTVLQPALWCVYWWFQGLLWAGLFCLGIAGHGSLFESSLANSVVGFSLHSFLLIPYFAWRSTHHAHHKATGSVERDENHVPYNREDFKLPPRPVARRSDYAEVFEEAPLFTLVRVFIMQAFGWWLYLTQNTLGAKHHPRGTNHFDPNSTLFKDHERSSIVVSDIGVGCMAGMLVYAGLQYGWAAVLAFYGVPYLLTNHWIVLFTYLHHSDPTIPHYYGSEWTFLRGVVATVDRPLLGWMGRFFLHNISHDHVAHHFFVGAPFYNGPKITKHIREVLKKDYNYDSTHTLYALWRSFTQCLFIEEGGGIVFYKNKEGKPARRLAPDALGQLNKKQKTVY